MSANLSYLFRRRPQQYDWTQLVQPKDGPDVAAPAGYQGPPMMQMPAMMPESDSGMGQAFGGLLGAGLNRAMQARAPELKPDASGNPLAMASGGLKPKGGGKFLGLFGYGGRLRRVGDMAVVGDEGPEVAVKKSGGETEIIPLGESILEQQRQRQLALAQSAAQQVSPAASAPGEVDTQTVPPTMRRIFTAPQWGQDTPVPAVEGNDPLTAPVAPVPEAARMILRRFTPPKWEDTGDERGDLTRYASELQGWRNPGDRDGRFKSSLKTGGMVARDVLRAGGNPVQALAALASGMIWGAASPNANERLSRDERLGETRGRLAQLDAQEEASLEREGKIADIGLKRANTMRALREPLVKPSPLQHVTVNDRAYTFDPNAGTYTDANLPGGAKLKQGSDELGIFLYDPTNPDAEVVRPKGAELKQFVDYQPIPGGVTYRVPATTAAQGDATIAASNATAANEGRRQSARDANEQSIRGWENDVADWRTAGSAVDEYNKSWRALEQNMAAIKALRSQPNFDQSSKEFQQLLQNNRRLSSEIRAAQGSLRSRYPKHVRFLDSGFAEVGPQPTKPSVVSTPAPAMRQPAGRKGAYAGHTFKAADLPEIQKRLGVKTPEEARRLVERQGGRFIE